MPGNVPGIALAPEGSVRSLASCPLVQRSLLVFPAQARVGLALFVVIDAPICNCARDPATDRNRWDSVCPSAASCSQCSVGPSVTLLSPPFKLVFLSAPCNFLVRSSGRRACQRRYRSPLSPPLQIASFTLVLVCAETRVCLLGPSAQGRLFRAAIASCDRRPTSSGPRCPTATDRKGLDLPVSALLEGVPVAVVVHPASVPRRIPMGVPDIDTVVAHVNDGQSHSFLLSGDVLHELPPRDHPRQASYLQGFMSTWANDATQKSSPRI